MKMPDGQTKIKFIKNYFQQAPPSEGKKVQQSRYRPGVAKRVPGS
jgi:hypothetical protein